MKVFVRSMVPILGVIALFSNASAGTALEAWHSPESVSEAAFGIFCLPDDPDRVSNTPGTLTGKTKVFDINPEFHEMHGTIPAIEDLNIGLMGFAKIRGPIDIELTHPPRTDSQISFQKWRLGNTFGKFAGFYTLNNSDGPMLGEWVFSANIKQKKVVIFRVQVVPVDPNNPHHVDPCKTRLVG